MPARVGAELAADEAREAYLQAKLSATKARAIIEEILQEIELGTSGRPLIDAANARGESGQEAEAPERTGFDLVVSRPGSAPQTNGIEAPSRPKKPRKKAAKKASE